MWLYLNELLIFSEVWQLLVFELSCLIEVLADQKLQIRTADWLIIFLQKVSYKRSVNHLLFSSCLGSDKLNESRPNLVHVAELLFNLTWIISGSLGLIELSILLCHYFSNL